MAKKEKAPKQEKVKQPKAPKEKGGKKGKKGAQADVPVTGTPSTPGGVPSAGSVPNGAGAPLSSVPPAMAPDPLSAAQIEQKLKDGTDPDMRLKKLHSPISVKSCLLNLLILIVMTVVIVIVWCYFKVDKFNFVTVVKDMSWQYGITQGFQWLWAQISGWFA